MRENDMKSTLSQEVNVTDYALLSNPLLNKGTAFTAKEREAFGLYGLLPPEESTMTQQLARSYETFRKKETPLDKYLYLRDLQDSNETLYYKLLCTHITEIMPIVYTPIVGEACQTFSHIYRRPRGIFIAYPYQHRIDEILANPRFDNVRAIVVSDGERILGLGDQGAGGMGIPIGKLALYSACSGIHPSQTLPILLDTGTNNEALIKDPLYIGWRHERIRGEEYDAFIDTFIQALKKRFPHVLLQWEDFALQNATRLLERYRNELCTFNDDVQGTAAVALGTLLSSIHKTKIPISMQRIMIAGAGSAGCGIANLIVQAMQEEGISEEEALSNVYLVDRNGLITDDMELLPFQARFAKKPLDLSKWTLSSSFIGLMDVVKNVKPHALIGVSGQGGLFDETLIREMASHVEIPVILPLSNPISHSEATPLNLIQWTNGRALIGTGSPFESILKNGNSFRVDQTNNVYIFPGIGLGLIASRTKKVTDPMFIKAARALAECSPLKNDPESNLLPPLTDVRKVSLEVALGVGKESIKEGLTDLSESELEKAIQDAIWEPEYREYRYVKK